MAGLTVMDQKVCFPKRLAQDFPALRVLQVQGDPLFAGVQVEEQAAALGMRHIAGKGAAAAGRVAHTGGFDLDYFCPEGGQQLAAEGTGYHLRDLHYAEAG